jgi:molybdopterin/thiamine biosynthesis adenylyltransferase/rhodanese-related sulfurtransferase
MKEWIPGLKERAADVELSPEEILRYSRHLIMPEVTLEGQRRLKAARVLVIGAGGLGSPALLYLAAAGVGHLGVVDFDRVDFSNLQRQVLYGTDDVGRPKLSCAAERLRSVNPHIEIQLHEVRLTSANALEILQGYDVILDGTDNFATRYLVNDACVLLGKPNVYGSIFRFDGQASVFYPPYGPCYRCLYPEPPPAGLVPSCAEGGVLGVLPGVVGCIQATEAVKLILNQGEPLIGRLLIYDALEMRFRELRVRRDPSCPICGENPTIRALIDYEEFCGVRGQEQAQAPLGADQVITVEELYERLQRGPRPVILDVRNPEEWQICHLNGAKLIPLAELPARVHELNPADEIVVHCRSGGRSAKAVHWLRQMGFQRVRSLKGGIVAWAEKIDPSLPRY